MTEDRFERLTRDEEWEARSRMGRDDARRLDDTQDAPPPVEPPHGGGCLIVLLAGLLAWLLIGVAQGV